MAILRLLDDALLVRSPGPELTSRLTGVGVPLDREEAIVVTLLQEGPVEADHLLPRVHEQGVSWSRETLDTFIQGLAGWGLLELGEGRPRDVADLFDPGERTVVDFSPRLPIGMAARAPEADAASRVDDAPRVPDALEEETPPDGGEASREPEPLERARSQPRALGRSRSQPRALDRAQSQPRALDRAQSQPHALDRAQSQPHALDRAQSQPHALDRAQSQPHVDRARSQPRVDRAQSQPRVDRARSQPNAALKASEEQASEEQPPGTPRPGQRLGHSEDLPTKVSLGNRRSAPARRTPRPVHEDEQHQPIHARLLSRWRPRLVPNSQDVLLVDPSTNAERSLPVPEYRVARMLDGNRSPEEIVDQAWSGGMQIELDDVREIIQRLVSAGIAEPGATPLPPVEVSPPGAPSREPEPEPEPDLSEELVGTPFAKLGDSPDSIVESFGFAPLPRKMPAPAPRKVSAPPVAKLGMNEALTRAAELVQADRDDEAKEVLRGLLDRDPSVVQALAMLELITGRQRPRARSRRLGWLWISAGVAGLALVVGLILTLVIQVEPRSTLPCRAELVHLDKVSVRVAGQISAVEVREGMMVEKGQVLARVDDVEHERRMADLQLRIADGRELLRIMRTSGSAEDERKQKKIIATLSAQLARSNCSAGQPCESELARVKDQIESARRKLKFCEWQAERNEITQVADQLTKMEQELASVTRKPPELIVSPRGGLVASVKIAKGQKVNRGAGAVLIADAKRFVVMARGVRASLEGAVPSQVRLEQGRAFHTYTPSARTATWQGDTLRVEVPAAVTTQLQGTCHLELCRKKISLLRSWFL